MEGVWESARANMDMYLRLAEKAREFRADPITQELMEEASVYELAQPTLDPGETIDDFLADRSAYEDFDADAKGARIPLRRALPSRNATPDWLRP